MHKLIDLSLDLQSNQFEERTEMSFIPSKSAHIFDAPLNVYGTVLTCVRGDTTYDERSSSDFE